MAGETHATNGAAAAVNPGTLRPSASARTKLPAPAEAAAASPSRDAPAGSSGRGGAAGDSRGDAANAGTHAEQRDALDDWKPEVPIPALQRLLQQARRMTEPLALCPHALLPAFGLPAVAQQYMRGRSSPCQTAANTPYVKYLTCAQAPCAHGLHCCVARRPALTAAS